MTEVKSICLLNLPLGITELKLQKELLRIFPSVFHGPCKNNTVKITIYPPKGLKTMGVVGGFIGNFEDMTKIAVENKILGRDIKMKWDRGDERDDEGNFSTKLPPETVRKLDELRGISHRKVLGIFNQSFLHDINPKVFDGLSQVSLYLNAVDFNNDVLRLPGKLLFSKPYGRNNFFRLQYSCVLDKFQAIRYLNNNERVCQPPPYFTDINGKEKSNCSEAKGLGKQGSLLKIHDERVRGLIRFDEFDPAIMSKELIKGQFLSYCWRCKSAYSLEGIDPELNFIGGICACSYSMGLDILDKSRAYHLESESITRLAPGQNGVTGLIVIHCPMKGNYQNASEYQDIVLPILQEEWKHNSREFKISNSCSGSLLSFQFVEKTEVKPGKKNNVYGLQIIVPATKFWCSDNLFAIGSVKISMNVYKIIRGENVKIQCHRKGKIRSIQNANEKEVSLFVQLEIESSVTPKLNEKVDVVPKPKKSEYNTTKHLIRKSVKEENPENPMFNILLNPQSRNSWEIADILKKSEIHLTPKLQTDYAKVLNMFDMLNPEQLLAVQKARRNTVSFIMGPPGTGKTYTASVVALTLSALEAEPILICAPSNVAADGIALSVEKLKRKSGLDPRILRIYSKSTEMQFLRTGNCESADSLNNEFLNSQNPPYKVLHREVQKLLIDEQIQDIVGKIKMGKEYCLKKAEREILLEQIRNLEYQVMMDYNIFVCTIGSMADKRLVSWSKTRPIFTVIVDEVGQATHPSIFTTLLVNPTRLIFAGDHLQLSPTVMSYSASSAGLNRSIMEWISITNTSENNIPWTTLLEQHRMAPLIRGIVSAVTYQNQLRDAPCVTTRDMEINEDLLISFPELKKSSVVVYDVKDTACVVGTSYMNEGEANKILLLVEKLLKAQVPASKITVLTLYEGQNQLIKRKFRSLGLSEELSVLNVDGFQGRENSIIILSFVRSNTKGSLGFIKIPNRLNVAISRAQNFLLIVCNFAIFKAYKSQAWKTFHDELIKIDNFVR